MLFYWILNKNGIKLTQQKQRKVNYGELMKKIFYVLGCIIFTAIFSFNYKGQIVKAADSEEGYVQVYEESDGISSLSYSDEKQMYWGLLNDDDELCAEVIIKISFEYSDGTWVDVNDALLDVHCYNGYKVNVSSERIFNNSSENSYCRRELTILYPTGMKAKYYVYAYADCYGEVDFTYQLVSTYY